MLKFIFSTSAHVATTYTMSVNGRPVSSPNDVARVSSPGVITVTCSVNSVNEEVTLLRIVNSQVKDLSNDLVNTFTNGEQQWTYTLPETERYSPTTYRCKEKSSESCPHYVQVTIYFNSEGTSPGRTIPNCAPSTSADSPSVIPPSTQSPSSSELYLLTYFQVTKVVLDKQTNISLERMC